MARNDRTLGEDLYRLDRARNSLLFALAWIVPGFILNTLFSPDRYVMDPWRWGAVGCIVISAVGLLRMAWYLIR